MLFVWHLSSQTCQHLRQNEQWLGNCDREDGKGAFQYLATVSQSRSHTAAADLTKVVDDDLHDLVVGKHKRMREFTVNRRVCGIFTSRHHGVERWDLLGHICNIVEESTVKLLAETVVVIYLDSYYGFPLPRLSMMTFREMVWSGSGRRGILSYGVRSKSSKSLNSSTNAAVGRSLDSS
jgi:hypothetical protein